MNGADPFRVLHLTDPHLFAEPDGELRGTATHASLARVVSHAKADAWQADLVLATGDIVQDDSAGAYRRFRELLGDFGAPVYCVPGNHDVRELMREELSAAPFHYCENIEAGNWLIVNLDSCVEGEVYGRVSDAGLTSLAEAIDTTTAENVLVCLHHPPVLMNSRWLDSVGLRNRQQFLQSLASSTRVRLLLFGHAHQDYEGVHDGVRILGTPSTCRQFLRHSEIFAVDDNPPAYRRLNLYTDGRFEHELIWVNDDSVY